MAIITRGGRSSWGSTGRPGAPHRGERQGLLKSGDTLHDGNGTRVAVVNAFTTVNPDTEAIVRAVDYQVVGAPEQFRVYSDDAGDIRTLDASRCVCPRPARSPHDVQGGVCHHRGSWRSDPGAGSRSSGRNGWPIRSAYSVDLRLQAAERFPPHLIHVFCQLLVAHSAVEL